MLQGLAAGAVTTNGSHLGGNPQTTTRQTDRVDAAATLDHPESYLDFFSKNAAASRTKSRSLFTRSYPRSTAASPHISPPFVARASRCRCDGRHGPEHGEGVADTTSSRLQGVRPDTASRSACVAEGR